MYYANVSQRGERGGCADSSIRERAVCLETGWVKVSLSSWLSAPLLRPALVSRAGGERAGFRTLASGVQLPLNDSNCTTANLPALSAPSFPCLSVVSADGCWIIHLSSLCAAKLGGALTWRCLDWQEDNKLIIIHRTLQCFYHEVGSVWF